MSVVGDSVVGDWYVNGGLRINFQEVAAIRPIDEGNRSVVLVYLRGHREPWSLQCASRGVQDLLEAFDRWRAGLS